jgi:mucin-22
MNRHRSISRMSAGRATLLAAAALALAGCSSGSSTSAVSSSVSSPAGGSATASTSAGGSFTGTALFPVAVGNTWVYKVTAVGLSTGTATDKITAVVPVAGGNQVTTTHRLNGTTAKETFLFSSDGSITTPLTSLGNATFKINSGGIVWPSQAQIDSGQPHTSTIAITTTIAGQTRNLTTHVTVQGAGPATVTVPAGTYHATVVEDTLAEKIAGISVSIHIRTWLVHGIGPVKSEVTTNGTTVSGEELKSFTRG